VGVMITVEVLEASSGVKKGVEDASGVEDACGVDEARGVGDA